LEEGDELGLNIPPSHSSRKSSSNSSIATKDVTYRNPDENTTGVPLLGVLYDVVIFVDDDVVFVFEVVVSDAVLEEFST